MKSKNRAWKIDDQVVVLIDEETYRGTIVELTKRKAQVLFEDGDDLEIATHRLMPYELDDSFDNEDVKSQDTESNIGFNQFNVHWDKHTINFKFKAGGGSFYGWWRKCSSHGDLVYAIDIHVQHKEDTFNVDSIYYYTGDPREDLYSLDSDICAACNKWFFHKCNGNFETIDSLLLKANQPTIIFKTIESLDMVIHEMKVFRDNAIRTGGCYTLILDPPDTEGNPKNGVRIQTHLFTQALGLKGRVPALYSGAILDTNTSVTGRKKNAHKKNREATSSVTVTSGSINQLMDQLKKSTNKTEKRKLRAALRKMGHRGGARNSK